jgi:hypothetical protein
LFIKAIDKCPDIQPGGLGFTDSLEDKCNNNGHVIGDVFNDFHWYQTYLNGRTTAKIRNVDCYSTGSNGEITVNILNNISTGNFDFIFLLNKF